MPRWRLPRPRFSLFTLLLGVVFVCACGGLWWRWAPWVVTRSTTHPGTVVSVGLSPDAHRCVAIYSPDLPDGPFLIENNEHYTPCIWDIATGQQWFGEQLTWRLAGPEDDHLTWRFDRFSPSADFVVLSASNNGGASFFCVLDARSGQELPLTGGRRWPIRNVDFSSDGQRMLYLEYTDETPFAAWVVDSKGGCERSLQLPTDFSAYDIFIPCALSPNGTRALIAARTENGAVVGVFDSVTGRHLVNLPGGPEGGLQMCLSPDGLRIAMQNDEGCALYDIRSGKVQCQLAERNDYTCDSAYSFSPDGQRILVHRLKGHSVILDAFTGKQLLRIEDSPRSGAYGNAHPWRFSRDGRKLFGGNMTAMQAVWDASDGRLLFETLGDATLSPDGRNMMVWSDVYGGKPPYLFDLETGNKLCNFDDPNQPVKDPSFSMDGQCFASHSGNRVDLWSRRRPEYWWGIAWLPEFWITLLSGCAVLIIGVRNLRRCFAKSATVPPAPKAR